MRPGLIFVPTVQHTGTHFVWRLLQSSPDVHRETTWRGKIRRGEWSQPREGTTILHSHFGDETYGDELEAHLREVEFWIRHLPSVTPMRDPVLAILSRRRRHPEISSRAYLVDGFVALARMETKPKFIRVDRPELGRGDVEAVFGELELTPGPETKALIQAWRPENRTAGDRISAAYVAGKLDVVAAAVPKSWRRLLKHRHILQPFFESLGYHSLRWYTDNGEQR